MTPLADEHADQTELTKEDRESLMQFETLNNQQIEFDKAKIGQKKKTEFR